MDTFNLVLAVISLLLALAGITFTFITFFAPDVILEWALKTDKSWREVPSPDDNHRLYRHRLLSGFSILVDLESDTTDFWEYWMNALHRPDKSASTHAVTIYFNGLPVDRVRFLLFDGSRNFIPLPDFHMNRVGNMRYVSFTGRKRQLAKIVGYVYLYERFNVLEEQIVNSRFNPEPIEYSYTHPTGAIEALEKRIAAFRSRSVLIG